MPIFHQLKQAVIQAVKNHTESNNLLSVEVAICVPAENSYLLSWLKAQSVYPKAFWQHREDDEQLAVLGATRQFNDLAEAEQFSQAHGLRLIGGLTFEGRVHFIVPRLLLVKNSQNLTACCTFYSHESEAILSFLENIAPPATLLLPQNRLLDSHAVSDFPRWAQNIAQAISQIQQQQFDKVVLANATTLTFSNPLCAYDLLFAGQQKNHGCYHFLWAENDEESFIGSSPERLYLREARQFKTEALAGTTAVSDDPIETEQNAQWLLNDHKNLYENWLVVDDICGHLADCTEDIEVGNAQIKRLRNVQHLRREIRTQLKNHISDHDCLTRLQPTAAVAGLPREMAKPFIAEHEGFTRGWYAGTLGYFSTEKAEFCVTLRSATIRENSMTLYAGAGIVEESDPQSEWQEITRKSLAMAGLITQLS